MSTQELSDLIKRLESVATRLESAESRVTGGGCGGSDAGEALPAFVAAYDEILQGPFQEYLRLSNQIGADVAKHAAMVQKAMSLQRSFIEIAAKSKKPATDTLVELLKPQSNEIQSVQSFREENRRSTQFNHLSAISESIPALGWVAVSPTPAPYVIEMANACQFYTNRVLVEYKDKDKTHVEWTRAWLAVLNQLRDYVKQYHTTGLVWNPRGGEAKAAAPSAPAAMSAPPPPPCGPPPPPPPPSADFLLGNSPSAPCGGGADVRAALFADINKGGDITKGLKKVSSDQQTHKNPALRGSSIVPAPKEGGAAPSGKPAIAAKPAAITKPPKIELEGKKWMVEYHRDQPQLVLDEVQMNQVVYIYGCFNTVVIVKGKCNSISIDNCKKTSVVFDDIVSMVEFINCHSVKAQSMGKVATVSIDKTDGAHIYLSEQSKECEIVTSKSSEVNVSIPAGDGDYNEFAVPEQFKTTWNGKTVKTEILDVAA